MSIEFCEAYLLKEDGFFLLLESGGKIILEQSILRSDFIEGARIRSTSPSADFQSDSASATFKGIT